MSNVNTVKTKNKIMINLIHSLIDITRENIDSSFKYVSKFGFASPDTIFLGQ